MLFTSFCFCFFISTILNQSRCHLPFIAIRCYHLLTACDTKSCNGSCGILTNSLCAVLWTDKFHKFCRDAYMCLNQQKTSVLSDFRHSGFEVSSAGFVLLQWKSIYAFRRVRTKSFKNVSCIVDILSWQKNCSISLSLSEVIFLSFSSLFQSDWCCV